MIVVNQLRKCYIVKFHFEMFYLIVFLILSPLNSVISNEIITNKLFSGNVDGLISAFGDFNADKLTDIFFITENGKKLEIYLAQEKEPYLNKSGISCSFKDHVITSSVPSDFNGDSKMDVLVTLKKNELSEDETIFKIIFGNLTNLSNCKLEEYEISKQVLRDQPLILDYNADTIPDIYGELLNGTRVVWMLNNNGSYSFKEISSKNKIRIPHSNAFLDLNGDFAADIFVTTVSKSFEIWYNEDGHYNKPFIINFTDPKVAILGQSAFLDMNLNGELDHILPVCFDENCKNSSVYIYDNGKWLRLTSPFQDDDDKYWGFENNKLQPITLRIGDYNLDGYPDVVAVLYMITGSTKSRRAVLLENKECKGCQYRRKFEPQWHFSGLDEIDNVTHVTFYDIYQDGNLDFLLVNENYTHAEKKIIRSVSAVQNVITNDVCFIKVFVSSGLCDYKCPLKSKPYGVNQPGPFIKYKTTRTDGSPQTSCAAQLSQSAYFALQIPYTVFGLGQTPNFVDNLTVGIPAASKKENYNHYWPSIIPNSQMIVMALKDSPDHYQWINRLFVTPSHQVLLTFIALIITCAVIVIVIGGLHWKEKVADKKEKLQEAHKFHFDAM